MQFRAPGRLILCVVLFALASGCVSMTADHLPAAAPKGRVTFSVEVDSGYLYNIGLLQDVDGKLVRLGRLRTGGIEVGDYKRITATARPGVATFYVYPGAISGLEGEPIPFTVDVVENQNTEVTLRMTPDGAGYKVVVVSVQKTGRP